MTDDVLNVQDLTVTYATRGGSVHAVNDVSFSIKRGESLGIVGESGSGKSTLALALMRILPDNGSISSGTVRLEDTDLTALSEREMARVRWSGVSMVFQAAMNALNPVYRVGDQIREAMANHLDLSNDEMDARIRSLFDLVGLDASLAQRYPHEYSGGMKQRAVIAMAMSCDPAVVIADEPTTALDVIVQDRIIKKLREIQDERQSGMIYISHDVAVIAEVADKIGVMYGGRMVEMGDTATVFQKPMHPYTRSLLDSVPSIVGPRKELNLLPGEPPDLMNPPRGCPFKDRCAFATDDCHRPPPRVNNDGRWADCWNPLEGDPLS